MSPLDRCGAGGSMNIYDSRNFMSPLYPIECKGKQ